MRKSNLIIEIISLENVIYFCGYPIEVVKFEWQLNSYQIKIDENESNKIFFPTEQVYECSSKLRATNCTLLRVQVLFLASVLLYYPLFLTFTFCTLNVLFSS
jgi:hypothetical protein